MSAAEHFSEGGAQPRQLPNAEGDVFARIGRLAYELGVTSAGAYFFRHSPLEGGSRKLLGVSREANTFFFAYNRTDPIAYGAGKRGRIMEAFLVDLEREELARLEPAAMDYSQQSKRWNGERKEGPLIIDQGGVVGIFSWSVPQLELQPVASSPQPNRLQYEKGPDSAIAEQLESRLSSFDKSDREERIMFPIGA